MKRGLKIFGWTLFSMLMVVIIALVIACYVLITPAHLTPIVRKIVGNYVTCEYEIGSVDLTIFSTFPRIEVRVDSIVLINPMEGAQNDTVLYAPSMTAAIDIKQLLFDNNLVVSEAVLEDAEVNYYIAQDGSSNIDIFVSNPDTLPEEPDTTAFALPFHDIRVDRLCMHAKKLTYKDAQTGATYAQMGNTMLSASAADWNSMYLHLTTDDLYACVSDETYADHVPFAMEAPLQVQWDSMHYHVDSARLRYDDYELVVDGGIRLGDTMQVDAYLRTSEWQIKSLLSHLPASLTDPVGSMKPDGLVRLEAKVKGALSDSVMPAVTADILLYKAQGDCDPLPYELRNVRLDAHANLDLNRLDKSKVLIRSLAAQTKKSRIRGAGFVNGLTEQMQMDLRVNVDANLADFAYFMPDSMDLTGEVSGDATVKICLEDLTQMELDKGAILADLDLRQIGYTMDSMTVHLPHTAASIQIPNPQTHKRTPTATWARIDLVTDTLDMKNGEAMYALAHKAKIHLETANVLQNTDDYYLTLHLDTLDARMDDTQANLSQPDVEMALEGGKRVSITLNSHTTGARMGQQLQASMDTLHLKVGSKYNENGKNWLLKWNPRFTIRMKNGELHVPERMPEAIYVPSIDFIYSNRKMTIKDSEMHLGNSDLHIKGDIERIGGWLRHDTTLAGTLDITSTYWDTEQLMEWTGDTDGSEEPEQPKEQTSKEPVKKKNFFVPKDVDFALNASIDSVNFSGHTMKQVRGGLFVRNASLILQEVGFICDAAKMQLTAEYKSPRSNHFYVGMDYHLVDVTIDSLISLIPQVVEIEPAIKAFRGNADFHFAVETYLDSLYQPKKSTMRGAASITAQQLTVVDSTTFNILKKLLLFRKRTENKIDSINAEMTIYKKEATLYPLCVQMDRYKAAVGGYHTLDNYQMDYDLNLLKPIHLGLKIYGLQTQPKHKLAKCKFQKDFQPTWFNKADSMGLEIRKRIMQSMQKNVTIK